MKAEGHAVSLICGGQKTGPDSGPVDIGMRDKVMSEFRSGVTKVLISTDVLARGIDIPAVTLVVNYELPVNFRDSGPEYETYIHRIGRTGRFGLRGVAVNLVRPAERSLVRDIEQYFSCWIEQADADP